MLTSIDDTNPEKHGIEGVIFKPLRSFPDDRGFFREVVRVSDDFFTTNSEEPAFAQWSHSKMGKNTVKAWHFHHKQIDWWYVGIGTLHVVLFDNREESATYKRKLEFKLCGDSEPEEGFCAAVRIPQGVLHGAKVISDTAHLFYITSQTYNREDEGRFAFNSEIVPHSWGNESELIVADNDRRDFIPPHPRVGTE